MSERTVSIGARQIGRGYGQETLARLTRQLADIQRTPAYVPLPEMTPYGRNPAAEIQQPGTYRAVGSRVGTLSNISASGRYRTFTGNEGVNVENERPQIRFDLEGTRRRTYDDTTFYNPKFYEVDPDQIKNTMDMIKVFRALLGKITVDESTVKQYGLEQYVKEK